MSHGKLKNTRLPSAEDLEQWRNERDRLLAEERALRHRRAKLDKLIEVAAAFIEAQEAEETEGQETKLQPESTPMPSRGPRAQGRTRPGTWADTILRIVRAANRGMTYGELKAEVQNTHLGETLVRTEKSFYGAIGRLAKRKNIIRHNGRIYTPEAFKMFMRDVETGLVRDVPVSSNPAHTSPTKEALLEFLGKRPNGATPGQVIEHLLINPRTRHVVSRDRRPVYNLLGRMRKRGELIKRGNVLILTSLQNEAPGSQEPDASAHNGGGSGNPSSTGSNRGGRLLAALPGATPAQPGE